VKRLYSLTILAVALFVVTSTAAAQGTIIVEAKRPMTVAAGNNLYCAGYIQSSAISTSNKVVGAQDEADKYNYSQNDFLYINMGRDKGVHIGDVFSVVRPRGQVHSHWSSKGGLGFYVQEVGAVEVIDVKQSVSVARVKASCDAFYLGDLVQPSEVRVSPMAENRAPLDRFAEPTGKAKGRILMARDNAETLARDFIAYVDLGADDHVQVGDHLTIYRSLERGNVNTLPMNEIVSENASGFDSYRYQGGTFSNQAPRRSGDTAQGSVVTTKKAKEGRGYLRKVVGEAVVLNVREKTATVVITRTGQEIHTGDHVEIQ
jgi:hypothetical protein